MNYKDCYFMHIPKTGGRYFRPNILSPLGLPSEFDKDFKLENIVVDVSQGKIMYKRM